MPKGSRRRFLAAACAPLLYGARRAFASEAAATLPRMAVLLPLSSAAFGRAAEAVKQGFERAARLESGAGFDITIYATTEDPQSILTGYQRAVAEAPGLIVGPLTRNGVTALLRQLQPGPALLALNVPEDEGALPQGAFCFSLQDETDARQVAQ
jgi:outer membrane PBP1 activator LpoA protein